MASSSIGNRDELRLELAATAARLIAEDGLDYATAKRKAAQLLLGEAGARGLMPGNDLVESELRRYLRTFGGIGHVSLLAQLRAIALGFMRYLDRFNPHLVGAVLNGTATAHSDLHLHLFTDSAKDVEMALLNDGISFEVDEAHEPAGALESIHLLLPRRFLAGRREPLGVVLSVLPTDAVRVAARQRSDDPWLSPAENSGRAGIAALEALLRAPPEAA